jgi:hypothetical protein
MPVSVRPGVFRPLRHSIPDNARWMRLDGRDARDLGLGSEIVIFAVCGSACWQAAYDVRGDLRLCPECFPGWVQRWHG